MSHRFKRAKPRQKIAMMTAYDAPTAEILDANGIDWVLVGDSVGMVLLGYSTTADVTMDEMIHHAKAARRGVKRAALIGDLPLKGIRKGPQQALASSKRFIKAGCDAVKLEWNKDSFATAKLLVKNRIPVMAHLGLTPQTAHKTGGYKVRGQEADSAWAIYENALKLEKIGVFAVLLECVPIPVARAITRALKIPTIGIGAGKHCDGQVLVFHDVIGSFKPFKPRFVKAFAQTGPLMAKAVKKYAASVKSGKFPDRAHSFGMKEDEMKLFEKKVNCG